MENSAAVILCGGKGTRMKSDLPKVLHKIGNKEMIFYSIDNVKKAGFEKTILLVGFKADEIKKTVGEVVEYAYQPEPLGTGDAANRSLVAVPENIKSVLIVNGDDSAFYNPETLKNIYDKHISDKNLLTFGVTLLENPTGIGRVVRDENGNVIKIVEEKDASDEEKKINEGNIGLYVFDVDWLRANSPKIKKSASGEYYIVDLIAMAIEQGKKVEAFNISNEEWHGINTQEELIKANEKVLSVI